MLRAALRGKSGDEDNLTSSVLVRLSYLPAKAQHDILQAAVQPLGSHASLPAPSGCVRWSFWPSLHASDDDPSHTQRVEPDALMTSDGAWWAVECKHRGAQYEAQWRAQIQAVRRRHPGALAFIAAGGAAQLAEARAWSANLTKISISTLVAAMPNDTDTKIFIGFTRSSASFQGQWKVALGVVLVFGELRGRAVFRTRRRTPRERAGS
jgi:hypothetical protein